MIKSIALLTSLFASFTLAEVYNSSSSLTYSQVVFKASHNSYDKDETPISTQLTWYNDKVYQCGCRGVELDIWRHSDKEGTTGLWTVNHNSGLVGEDLAYYLSDLKSYHANNPNHDVILVTLDIKSKEGSVTPFPTQIDSYLTDYFGDTLIFKPNQLFYNKSTLCEGVTTYGWPTLDQLKGKFIFCLSGNADWKDYYANQDLKSRTCFSDVDIPDDYVFDSKYLDSFTNIVFYNFHIYTEHYNTWKTTFPLLKKYNYLSRVYVTNDETLWKDAQSASVSVIATDKVSNYEWAHVGNEPFASRT